MNLFFLLKVFDSELRMVLRAKEKLANLLYFAGGPHRNEEEMEN